ncbi:PA14 domain-containing protein [Flavobacterium cutihirudinis]|uniref:PA14 domain-containing protein n=1 Tax=Flavobacterium cutihirudinis TaxID=1265740 RepID=A0A3D9FVC7_9FLAO|nr:T9SS sorting signal type C domain-containing protein [Flavobacterium cutihirudinis]RED24745.1 PA14 domain-containing protein [Flavobacterium cutihirudinis]
MKKTLLLFLLLLPFFGFSQTDLVKWNAAKSDTNSPTVHPDAVSANISITDNRSMNYTNNSGENVFYNTGSWPSPAVNGGTYDPTKYISLQISAAPNRKLDLTSLTFQCRSEGNTNNFRIKYSKDPSFIKDVKDLMSETISTSTWTTYNPSFLPEINPILPTQILYIRIYVYNTYNNFQLKIGSVSSNSAITIKGNVSNFDPNTILAIDDYATTTKNETINIPLISNDVKGSSNINNLTITTKPNVSEGSVTINPDYSVTFNPALSYVGNTSFTYTIKNATQSSTGTVYLTVKDREEVNLALWNGAGSSYTPVLNSYVTSGPIAASGGVGLDYRNNSGSNIFFETSNWPNPQQNGGSFDPTKFVTFKISPDQDHKIDLTSFNFTYRRNGNNDPQKFRVTYSKDPNFVTNVKTFVPETSSAGSWATLNNTFASDLSSLIPTETMYIRFYVYNTNNSYYIQNGNGNSVGPVIRGYVRAINSLAAYDDSATTPANQAVTIQNLSNDIIAPTPLQTMTITTQSLNGTAVANGLKDITFTPAPGYSGTTTFIYTLFNGTSYSSATVTVTVTPPPCIATLTPGTDSWKGYVYTYTGNVPAMTTYVGTIAEKAIFDRDVKANAITGDQSVAIDAFCNTAPIDQFYVRYLMNTVIPAGTYNFTIGGDDGVRLYMDGALVAVSPSGSWGRHGYSNYAAQITFTESKTHQFILEYYDVEDLARVSFSYGEIKGNNVELPYGINEWNVYGFTVPDVTLPGFSYAGTYVDTNLNVDTQKKWTKSKSPSSAANWQGAPIGTDNFTITYKRQGFPCGRYKIQLVNCDNVGLIYIDGTLIYTQNGYYPGPAKDTDGKFYLLNSNSKIEIILREDASDANIAVNFVDTPLAYNGTGTAPSKTSSIEIAANTTLQSDLEVCSCTIKPGVTLTVPVDRTLTVNETITVGDKGKLLIESGGSLIQTTTSKTAFTGAMDAFELQRETTPVRRYDYTRWSSPVTKTPGFTLHDLSPDTLGDKYWSYTPGSGWTLSYGGGQIMYAGMGYNVRAPQTFSITEKKAFRASFFGIPNNGDYEVTPVGGQYNLIGNPYPSALDAKKFIKDNENAGTIIGAIYLWTHNSSPVDTDGDGIYTYTTDDYAIFSLSGGIATQRSKSGTGTGNTNEPNGKITSGQGFFMLASNANKIKFTNDMRIGANNNQFFKTTGDSEPEENRIWLNFTNAKGAFKQLLVGYIKGATDSWDDNYDAGTMSSNAYIDFYSINENDKLAIQGRAVPFANTDEVPLGYVTTIAGDFTISIDHVDGLFNEQAIYLEDKVTGKEIDLRAGNYTFNTIIGTFTNRFVLRYTSKTLGTGDFENIENDLIVSVKDKVVKVQSAKENIKQISVYDISGKLLYDKTKVNQTEYEIANLRATNQLLLVKITLENGHTDSKKIIIN